MQADFSSRNRSISELSTDRSRLLSEIFFPVKSDVILFITGFHLANYTKQNFFDAKDVDAENNIDKLMSGAEFSKRYREAWIENIINVSKQNPNKLFVIKKHPIECYKDYIKLTEIKNILYIHEDFDIQDIIPFAGLFFHYGSTALVDSYLSRVPSVYVYSPEENQWYPDFGWPSSKKVVVDGIPEIIKTFNAGEISFELTKDIKKVMEDVFNIEEGKPYKPSREIAQIIFDPQPPQKIHITDRYLLKAVIDIFLDQTFRRLGRLTKKIYQHFKTK